MVLFEQRGGGKTATTAEKTSRAKAQTRGVGQGEVKSKEREKEKGVKRTKKDDPCQQNPQGKQSKQYNKANMSLCSFSPCHPPGLMQ
jgi:hypothetical protein